MKKAGERCFATNISDALIDRIRLEALRRGVPIQQLVSETLDSGIPKVRIVVDGGGDQQGARNLRGLKS